MFQIKPRSGNTCGRLYVWSRSTVQPQLENMSPAGGVIQSEESGIVIPDYVICIDTQVVPATGDPKASTFLFTKIQG